MRCAVDLDDPVVGPATLGRQALTPQIRDQVAERVAKHDLGVDAVGLRPWFKPVKRLKLVAVSVRAQADRGRPPGPGTRRPEP